jgi:HEAT repeat protein
MFSRIALYNLGLLLGLAVVAGSQTVSAAEKGYDPDVELLKQAKLGTDGPTLLAYLRKQTGNDADLLQLENLVRQLGDKNYRVRQNATQRIIALGPLALHALESTQRNPSAEVKERGKKCIQTIRKNFDWGTPVAAIRLLTRLKPAGTLEVLLGYLPYATSDDAVVELWYSIDPLSVAKGKVHAALVKALANRVPARRALAGCLVGRKGDAAQKKLVHALLKDTDPIVRLRAAQGMLAGENPEAIPVLIALIEAHTVLIAWQAEELLHWLAGDTAPVVTVGAGKGDTPKKCRTAWESWWVKHGTSLDWAKVRQDHRRPGLILVWEQSHAGSAGKLWLYGCDGMPRWEMDIIGLQHAQLLPNGSLLLTELCNPGLLERKNNPTEEERNKGWYHVRVRTLEGTVVSQLQIDPEKPEPWIARRMPDGSTFILDTMDLKVYRPGWRPKYTLPGFQRGLRPLKARFEGNGTIVCICTDRTGTPILIRLHARSGEEMSRTKLGVSNTDLFKGVERLRNGNTVVVSNLPSLFNRFSELDSKGKKVVEVFGPDRVAKPCFQDCLSLVRVGFDRPRSSELNLDSVPALLQAIRSQNPLVRLNSIYSLSKYGLKVKGVSLALVEGLRDPDKKVRNWTKSIWADFGSEGVPHLMIALQRKEPRIWAEAAITLGEMGAKAKPAFPLLLKGLKNENPRVRYAALWASSRIDDTARTIVQATIEAIKDENAEVRNNGFETIEWLGSRAKVAIPILLEMMKGKDLDQRKRAVRALGKVGRGAKVVLNTFLEATKKEKDVELRAEVIMALGHLGGDTQKVVPPLLEAFKTRELRDEKAIRRIRIAVLLSFGFMGRDAKPAMTTIVKFIKDRQITGDELGTALFALGKIGPTTGECALVLAALVKDKKVDVLNRRQAVRIITAMGPNAKAVIPILKEVLIRDYPKIDSQLLMEITKALTALQPQK